MKYEDETEEEKQLRIETSKTTYRKFDPSKIGNKANKDQLI